MSDEAPEQGAGQIGWQDLTVDNAVQVRDFYSEVAGWTWQPLSMGDYDDYVMLAPDSESGTAGVCHRKGDNANLPAQWLIYINVQDLEASLANVMRLGGEIVDGPRALGDGRFAVIRDPAGAVCGLIEA